MKYIDLTRGLRAKVSDRCYEELSKYRWSALLANGLWYAVRYVKRIDGKWRPLLMHRQILGLDFGNKLTGDHINHDTLDNTDENLRACSFPDNLKNRTRHLDSKSGVLGVYYSTERNKFCACLRLKGRSIALGRFDTLEEAKAARIEAEQKYFGEFAPQRELDIVKG